MRTSRSKRSTRLRWDFSLFSLRFVTLALLLFTDNITGQRIHSSPRRRRQNGEDVTTVLLVDSHGRSQFGRFLSVKPDVGLLTSTARTFIQEGVTTEYATQVLGTTLDNGRLYAHLLTKTSRVLYDNDSTPPTRASPAAFEPAANSKKWHVADAHHASKGNFVRNTDFISPNQVDSPFVVFPTSSPLKSAALELKDEAKDAASDEELLQAPSNNPRVPFEESKKESRTFSVRSGANNNVKVFQIHPQHRGAMEMAPAGGKLAHDSDENDVIQKDELGPSKVREWDNLPTFTVRNEFSPSGFSFLGDLPNFDVNTERSKQTTAAERRAKLLFKGGVPNRSDLKTVTYTGFADFTTTVGDTVIVFTPQSDEPVQASSQQIRPTSTLHEPPIATRVKTFLNHEPGVQTETVAGHKLTMEKRLPTMVVESASRMPKQKELPKEVTKEILDSVTQGKKEYAQPPHALGTPSLENSRRTMGGSTIIFAPDEIQPSESQTLMLSTPSDEDIAQIFASLQAKAAQQATEPLNTPSTVFFEDLVTSSSEKPLGGATTIFFDDDEITETSNVPQITAALTTTPRQLPETSSEETSTEEVTDESLEKQTTENVIASTFKNDITTNDIPLSTTELEQTTTELQDTTVFNDVLNEFGSSEEEPESDKCQDGFKIIPATSYKTLTYLTTFFIPGEEGETSTSIKSNKVVSTEVSQETQKCIQATAAVTTIQPSDTTTESIETTTEQLTESTETDITTENPTTTLLPVDDLETGEESATTENIPSEITTERRHVTESEPETTELTTENGEEIELLFKTLYTTYTYLTTYFQESTSSVASRKVVITNVITSTLDPSSQPSDDPIASLINQDFKTKPVTFEDFAEISPSGVGIGRPTTTPDGSITLEDSESMFTDVSKATPALSEKNLLHTQNALKTYYTTYTYFTTIFVDGETEISSRTEVYTNYVKPTPLSGEIKATPTPQFDTDDVKNKIMAMDLGGGNYNSTISRQKTVDNNIENNILSTAAATNVPSTQDSSENDLLDLPEYETIATMVTDVRSSTSRGEKRILDSDKRNVLLDDQIVSESNNESEIIPSPTLLLQTSYTTFTYFTTMYQGTTSSNIVSRLETVTNVVTETLTPTHTLSAEDLSLPITYFTTFTYWTTLYKDGTTKVTSREETVSNVVTPTHGTDATAMPELEATSVVVAPFELQTTRVSLADADADTLSKPASMIEASVEPTKVLGANDDQTTYYTTYTYYTTSYVGNSTVLNSRLETVTNVVNKTMELDNQIGRAIGQGLLNTVGAAKDAKDKDIKPTGLLSTIKSTVENSGTKTILSTDVYATYIDGLYAKVLESTSIIVTAPLDEEDAETATLSISASKSEEKLKPTGVVSINQGQIVDADAISTLFYVTKAVGTYIDNLYAQVIESTSSFKVDEDKKAAQTEQPPAHRTGLVRLIEGSIVHMHTTTVYQSKVLGTVIDGRYAQIIESTSSFIVEPTISPTATENIQVTPTSSISPSPVVIEGSISDTARNSEDSTENPDEDDENSTEDSDGRVKSRLTFQSRKRTFTPVIRPFASRAKPTFAPKRKGTKTGSATTITRSDFTPTVTAIPATKSASRFGGGRKSSSVVAVVPSASGSRRFSRPRSSSTSAAAGVSSTFVPNRGRSSSRVQPTAAVLGSSSRRTGGFRSSAVSSASIRPSSSFNANNRFARIRPTASFNNNRNSVTLPSTIADEENDLTTQVTDNPSSIDENETTTTAVEVTSSRRNANPLLRFRRPPISRATTAPRTTTSKPAVAPSGNARTTSGRNGRVTTTPTPKTTRASARNNAIQARARPSNSLFPRRNLFTTTTTAEPEAEDGEELEPIDEIENSGNEDTKFEGTDTQTHSVSVLAPVERGVSNGNSVVIKPFIRKRAKRQTSSTSTYSRFRRPTSRTTPVPVEEEPETELPRTRSRYTGYDTRRRTTPMPRITPSKPTSRSQFTLRDTSNPRANNFRRPSASTVSSNLRKPTSRPSSRLSSSLRSSNTERSTSSSNKSRKTSRRRGSTRGKLTDIDSNYVLPGSDGTITVTHQIPTEVTIPVVNGKITEYKNIVTAKLSTEILGPKQYSTTTNPFGKDVTILLSDSTGFGANGVQQVTRYTLNESPTTTVIFTPTYIRGRKTSFSHVIPSTVYVVDPIVNTLTPSLPQTPLANILLSQLLLGQQQANPLLGLQQPGTVVQGTPTTEYKTRTTTYVTTVTSETSTVIPLTFRGKEILTTIIDSSTNVVTATEFITDTVVVTPTPVIQQNQQLNSLLVPLLLQQQQQQQQINPLFQQQHFQQNPAGVIATNSNEELFKKALFQEAEQTKANLALDEEIEANEDYQNVDDITETPRKPTRANKKPPKPTTPETSVITLYVSGRMPGEFSTVLSTVVVGEENKKKREVTYVPVQPSKLYDDLVISTLEYVDTYVMPAMSDVPLDQSEPSFAPTESLESILGDVSKKSVTDTPVASLKPTKPGSLASKKYKLNVVDLYEYVPLISKVAPGTSTNFLQRDTENWRTEIYQNLSLLIDDDDQTKLAFRTNNQENFKFVDENASQRRIAEDGKDGNATILARSKRQTNITANQRRFTKKLIRIEPIYIKSIDIQSTNYYNPEDYLNLRRYIDSNDEYIGSPSSSTLKLEESSDDDDGDSKDDGNLEDEAVEKEAMPRNFHRKRVIKKIRKPMELTTPAAPDANAARKRILVTKRRLIQPTTPHQLPPTIRPTRRVRVKKIKHLVNPIGELFEPETDTTTESVTPESTSDDNLRVVTETSSENTIDEFAELAELNFTINNANLAEFAKSVDEDREEAIEGYDDEVTQSPPLPDYKPFFPELSETFDAPVLLLKTTVLSTVETRTQTTLSSKLRTYTFVVTRVNGDEQIVTSMTEVKPHTKTLTLTDTTTRYTTLTLLDLDATESLLPFISMTELNPSSMASSQLTSYPEPRGMEEARYNLATRVMSNGVEVIVAGDKTTLPGEPDIKRVLPSSIYKAVTLKPSTLTNNMMMIVPQEASKIESLSSSLYPNQFVTKTCLTTFTYLTTYLENGTTTVSSHEQVVSNVATEERNTGNTGKILPTPTMGITLTQYPNLAVGTFVTTYTYLNTILDGEQPLVVTSKRLVSNTVTAPDDYLSLFQPNDRASAVKDTNTYYSTIALEKTLYEGKISKVIRTNEIVTQVVITESIPPKGTSVMTSYIALDFNENDEHTNEYSTTDVVKTYFVTYTYYNTLVDGASTIVNTNVSTSRDVVTEKLFLHPKKKAAKPSVINTSPIGKDSGSSNNKKKHKLESELANLNIVATKTYLTTFTYFTTLLQEDGDELSTVISSHSNVVENVVTEIIEPALLDKKYLHSLKKEIKESGGSTVTKNATLSDGQKIEITVAIKDKDHIKPSKVLPTIEKTQMPEISSSTPNIESSNPNVVTGSTIIFVDEFDDPFAQAVTKQSTPSLTKVSKTQSKNALSSLLSSEIVKKPPPSHASASSTKRKVHAKRKTTIHAMKPTHAHASTSKITDWEKEKDAEKEKKPAKVAKPAQAASSPVSNLLSSINIQALRPVLNAMAGLIHNNLKSKHNESAHQKPIAAEQHQQQPEYANEVQNRSPIYIPVGGLTDIETAESQNIPALHRWEEEKEEVTKLSHESPLLNGGIPISPGEVITANSDVIVGKPGRIGPRIPAIPLNHPDLATALPQDIEGMKPPPVQQKAWPKRQSDQQHAAADHPIVHVPNKDDYVGPPPPPPPVQKIPVRPQNVVRGNKHDGGREQITIPINEQFYLNTNPPQQKLEIYVQDDGNRYTEDGLIIASSMGANVGLQSSHINDQQIVLPEVIERSTGQPLLINIQPSQVAFVNIPHNRTTALIYGGSTEPHINGQYFDDPSPYPEPEFSAIESFSNGVPKIASVYNGQGQLNQKEVGGVIKVGNHAINIKPHSIPLGFGQIDIRPSKPNLDYVNGVHVDSHVNHHDINVNVPPISFGMVQQGNEFNAHIIKHEGMNAMDNRPAQSYDNTKVESSNFVVMGGGLPKPQERPVERPRPPQVPLVGDHQRPHDYYSKTQLRRPYEHGGHGGSVENNIRLDVHGQQTNDRRPIEDNNVRPIESRPPPPGQAYRPIEHKPRPIEHGTWPADKHIARPNAQRPIEPHRQPIEHDRPEYAGRPQQVVEHNIHQVRPSGDAPNIYNQYAKPPPHFHNRQNRPKYPQRPQQMNVPKPAVLSGFMNPPRPGPPQEVFNKEPNILHFPIEVENNENYVNEAGEVIQESNSRPLTPGQLPHELLRPNATNKPIATDQSLSPNNFNNIPHESDILAYKPHIKQPRPFDNNPVVRPENQQSNQINHQESNMIVQSGNPNIYANVFDKDPPVTKLHASSNHHHNGPVYIPTTTERNEYLNRINQRYTHRPRVTSLPLDNQRIPQNNYQQNTHALYTPASQTEEPYEKQSIDNKQSGIFVFNSQDIPHRRRATTPSIKTVTTPTTTEATTTSTTTTTSPPALATTTKKHLSTIPEGLQLNIGEIQKINSDFRPPSHQASPAFVQQSIANITRVNKPLDIEIMKPPPPEVPIVGLAAPTNVPDVLLNPPKVEVVRIPSRTTIKPAANEIVMGMNPPPPAPPAQEIVPPAPTAVTIPNDTYKPQLYVENDVPDETTSRTTTKQSTYMFELPPTTQSPRQRRPITRRPNHRRTTISTMQVDTTRPILGNVYHHNKNPYRDTTIPNLILDARNNTQQSHRNHYFDINRHRNPYLSTTTAQSETTSVRNTSKYFEIRRKTEKVTNAPGTETTTEQQSNDLESQETGIPMEQEVPDHTPPLPTGSVESVELEFTRPLATVQPTHHAGNEVKIVDPTTSTHKRRIVTSIFKRPIHRNGSSTTIILPTRYVTHTKTSTVTITKTTIVKSLDGPPSTMTILVTKTEKLTMVDTVTEVHTLVKPTTIAETITVSPTSVHRMPDASDVPKLADDHYIDEYPIRPTLVHSSEVEPTIVIDGTNTDDFDDFIIHDADEHLHDDKPQRGKDDGDTFFVVMNDKNQGSVIKIPKQQQQPTVAKEDGNRETQQRDEMINTNEVNRLLLGGILIQPPPSLEILPDKCTPECKPSRNELCQRVDGLMRCLCRPGFARMFPDRPCKPTYTYTLKIGLERDGSNLLSYNDSLANETSVHYSKLARVTHEGLDRMLMQSDLRDIYHGVTIQTFAPIDEETQGVYSTFNLQLSDNTDESRLKDVFKKYLRNNNYSLGGTDLFASRGVLERLDANDFNECAHAQYHDCSEYAQCFNLRGTYTCSCRESYADLSENILYPGRICSAELIGCEKCHYHGTCYARSDDKTLCECFQWYAGESCQINLKVLLIALVTLGAILFTLLLICIIVTCARKRPQHVIAGSGMAFLPQPRRGTIDRRAMIQDTSSESGSDTLPYVVKGVNKKLPKASMPPGRKPAAGEREIVYPDQKDRSLTVMIPRAKYHPAPNGQYGGSSTNLTTFDIRKNSAASSNEAKLLSYLDAGPSPNKAEQRNISKSSDLCTREGPSLRKTSGALVSAGFEVSATVGVNNMGTLGTIATTCGTEADRSENATLIQKISAELRSSTGTHSQFNTLGKSIADTVDTDEDVVENWLDITPRIQTISESRSYDETTIQVPMKSFKRDYDTKSSQHNHDEANTMAERDLGSTFLLPHTHLYKPDRGSDISGFESL